MFLLNAIHDSKFIQNPFVSGQRAKSKFTLSFPIFFLAELGSLAKTKFMQNVYTRIKRLLLPLPKPIGKDILFIFIFCYISKAIRHVLKIHFLKACGKSFLHGSVVKSLPVQRHWFNPWTGKIHAAEQLSTLAITIEPVL